MKESAPHWMRASASELAYKREHSFVVGNRDLCE